MINLRRRNFQQPWKPNHQPEDVNQLEMIFSSIHASMAYLDLDAKIIQISPALAKITGHSPDSLLGKPISSIFPMKGKQAVVEAVIKTGQPHFEQRTPFRSPNHSENGTTFWDWSLQLIQSMDGGGAGLLMIARDVTEYTLAENALKESQEVLQHLFESDPDANILVDGDGKIISINKQAEADFGFRRNELVGKKIEVLIPSHKHHLHTELRKNFLNNPRKQFMGPHDEIFGRRKNGEEFPLEVTLSPLKMEKGVLILAVARDITQRKEMEREIAEVQHRLIESAETERLRLAQELHDGPMQDLYGVTYQLHSIQAGIPDPQTREDMVLTYQAVNQVISTLREMCSNLRPTALLPFGLSRAISSHAERFRGMYPNLTVHLELMNDGVRLPETIRLALYRIYQNLVSNVVRHAQANQIWIRFSIEGEQVILEVEDDGVGFTFPHRYVELVRKGHFGLAGAAERAEAIGGTVEIVTAPGNGTRIRISVPVPGVYQPEEQASLSSSR